MCEYDENCAGGVDQVLADTFDRIDRFGWSLIGVLGDGGSAPFAYTVGLTALGYPELAMYGLPPEASAPWLNAVADRVVRTGPVQHGARLVTVDGPAGGAGLVAIRMTRSGNLVVAEEVYPGDPILAMQLVWRDLDGLLPWQDGYDGARCPQPLFGPPAGLLSGPVLVGQEPPRRSRPARYRRRWAS